MAFHTDMKRRQTLKPPYKCIVLGFIFSEPKVIEVKLARRDKFLVKADLAKSFSFDIETIVLDQTMKLQLGR